MSFLADIVWFCQNVIPVINAIFVVWSLLCKVRKQLCKSQLRDDEKEVIQPLSTP